MKISISWLKEYIDFNVGAKELAEKLTMAGLEVDTIESVAPGFQGVVVGEVTETKPHPDADKLTLCKVNIGDDKELQIVCGASNVRPNLKVPVAVIGAELPNNFKIKKAKLRGVESEGMICAASEIGLVDDSKGIMELPSDAPIGSNIREYLNLDDEIIDIELTANRGDCLSIFGVAREVLAISPSSFPHVSSGNPEKFVTNNDEVFPVTLTAKEWCPKYCGRIIRGVDNGVATPLWMKERLKHLGVNPINFVVDVTNYVMLELGGPLHAFDLSKLDEKIEVRLARDDESIELLDGSNVELTNETLVIADKSKPIAIAGIMGGSETGVLEDTKDIFLESAFFIPKKVSVEARKCGLQTDSSYRFERGVDYELQQRALDRATSLIIEIAGGKPGKITEEVAKEYIPKKPEIILRHESIKNILGMSIEKEKITSIFNSLGMKSEVIYEGFKVDIPSFRFDIEIEADLIEELARIYGYHLIPEQKIVAELEYNKKAQERNVRNRLYALMEDLGYHEVVTYSFIDEKLQDLFGGGVRALPIANPISSEMSVMRTTLLPGLVNVVKHNINRQHKRGRFFEIGMKFLPTDDDLEQKLVISGVIYGDLYEKQWGVNQEADFFDIKNDVNTILRLFTDGNIKYLPKSLGALHPKRSASIFLDDISIGFVGEIHPFVKEQIDIDKKLYFFEIDLDSLANKPRTSFKRFSKYPQITRDIAIIVDKEISWSNIHQKIVDISGELLQNTLLFDVYCNENIGLDQRSMAIRLIFQSVDRTLVDTEIEDLVDKIVLDLKQTFGASLRG